MLAVVGCDLWLNCWPYASVPVLTISSSTGSVCGQREWGTDGEEWAEKSQRSAKECRGKGTEIC